MQKADKSEEQSLEDILASVRKLMAEAPPAEPTRPEPAAQPAAIGDQPARSVAPPGNDLSDILDEPTAPASRGSSAAGQSLSDWPFTNPATPPAGGVPGAEPAQDSAPAKDANLRDALAGGEGPTADITARDNIAENTAGPVESPLAGSGVFPNPQPTSPDDATQGSPLVARLRELTPGAPAKSLGDTGPDTAASAEAGLAEARPEEPEKAGPEKARTEKVGPEKAETETAEADDAAVAQVSPTPLAGRPEPTTGEIGLGSPASSGSAPIEVAIEPLTPTDDAVAADAEEKETPPEPADKRDGPAEPGAAVAGSSSLPTAVAESLAAIAGPALPLVTPPDDGPADPEPEEPAAEAASTAETATIKDDAVATDQAEAAGTEADAASLEARFTELLRPIVHQWLDENLADLVDKAVEKKLGERS